MGEVIGNKSRRCCVLVRMNLVLPAITLGLLTLPACDVTDWGGFERFSRDFHYSYSLRSGGRLTIENFNGSVEISTWDQQTVDISGTKYGPTAQAAEDLRIEIDHPGDSVSIRAVRPSERRNNLGARFAIKVPRGTLLDRITTSNGGIRIADGIGPSRLRTSNGTISVQGLHGALDAQTSNGAVELTGVEGDVMAHTSNGRIHADRVLGNFEAVTSNSSIRAEITRANSPIHVESSNGPIELALPEGLGYSLRAHTTNSSITLRLPESLNAHVIAHTSNSSITTDFPASMQGEISKRDMDAVIGAGGPMIDLSTSNGPIRLAKM
jgi:Putative adhesin